MNNLRSLTIWHYRPYQLHSLFSHHLEFAHSLLCPVNVPCSLMLVFTFISFPWFLISSKSSSYFKCLFNAIPKPLESNRCSWYFAFAAVILNWLHICLLVYELLEDWGKTWSSFYHPHHPTQYLTKGSASILWKNERVTK